MRIIRKFSAPWCGEMALGAVGEGRFQVGARVYRALAEEVFFSSVLAGF